MPCTRGTSTWFSWIGVLGLRGLCVPFLVVLIGEHSDADLPSCCRALFDLHP